jgi:hypothetical protein
LHENSPERTQARPALVARQCRNELSSGEQFLPFRGGDSVLQLAGAGHAGEVDQRTERRSDGYPVDLIAFIPLQPGYSSHPDAGRL